MKHHTRSFVIMVVIVLSSSALATASASAAAPAIPLITFSHLTTSSINLEAEIKPEGKGTNYHFEYGPTDCSANPNPCTSTPIPEGKIKAGEPSARVSAEVKGLTPGTTYHFRVVAKNSDDKTASPDRAFTTFTPSQPVEPCPNDQFRGPSAKLPDCRAYEQATPVNKNGVDITGGLFLNRASLAGDAITVFSLSGIPGGVGAEEFPLYISGRAAAGWSTQGLLPPPFYGEKAFVRGWTPDLAYAFDVANNFAQGTSAFLSRSAAGEIETIAPQTPGALYSFVADSADHSKVFFEASGAGAGLTAEAVAGKDNLYLWDRDTGELSLVGVLPDSACPSSPPCAPAAGSFAGAYDWWGGSDDSNSLSRGGAAREYFTQEQHTISSKGDKAYFTTGGEGQIYLRKGLDGPTLSTAHVSLSRKDNGSGPGGTDGAGTKPAAFQMATPDGAHAFFTSSEMLTNDANTGPEQLAPPPPPPPAIARASIDGIGGADLGFLPRSADGIAVDGSHIYWTNRENGTIGRATLNGSGAATEEDPEFIVGLTEPNFLTVAGEYVYWTDDVNGGDGHGVIGRAKLGPSEAEDIRPEFITGASNPQGIDVDSTNIYWTNDGSFYETHTISRAGLDGSGVKLQFIELAEHSHPRGVAVNDTHIFWIEDNTSGYVNRRKIDGGPSEFYLDTGQEGQEPSGIALDENHVFWTGQKSSTIGRADLNLSIDSRDPQFITGAEHPQGLALDGSHLYWSTHPHPIEIINPGNDLYRYDASTDDLTDLTADPAHVNGAEVQGVIGASDSGSYVYFVANGDLDGEGGPATTGNCHKSGGYFSYSGTCNLYLAHGGAFIFIARLSPSGPFQLSDAANWAPNAYGGGGNTAAQVMDVGRVSGDGQTLLFRSQRQLGAFANGGVPEFYRYRFGDPEPIVCVSCNANGAAPIGPPTLRSIEPGSLSTESNGSFLLRNLSADGNRVFFESPDKLDLADVNGDAGCPQVANGVSAVRACQDVYEWEANGTGSCQSAPGCLYLLSAGDGPGPSFFADASASGDDAFFFTRDALVGQDQDDLVDVYDARAGGGLASQNPPTPPVPCEAGGCRDGTGESPNAQSPGTSYFHGSGNPKPNRSHKRHRHKNRRHKRKHHQRPDRKRQAQRAGGVEHGGAK
jgi:virginiamycin B lyase